MYNLLLLLLLSLLAQRTNFLYHQLCISIVDILETPCNPFPLVAVLTFCVFNNIYLKAETIGQKCANCSCKLHWAKKKKWIHKRKEKRKSIEKLMAKFENYANQSATMGVTWRRDGELRELSNQRIFQIHWKNEKKKLFSWQAKKCNWNVYLN